MDLQTVVAIVSLAFGAGGFVMGALVTKNEVSGLKTIIETNRREEREYLQRWVEQHFQRKPA